MQLKSVGFEDGDDGGLLDDMVDPGCWGKRADRAAVGRGGLWGIPNKWSWYGVLWKDVG